MSAKDGGAAFPRVGEIGAEVYINYPGMTLRDYFAAKAMQGFCAASDPCMAAGFAQDIARCAYAQADAMLAARNTEAE